MQFDYQSFDLNSLPGRAGKLSAKLRDMKADSRYEANEVTNSF